MPHLRLERGNLFDWKSPKDEKLLKSRKFYSIIERLLEGIIIESNYNLFKKMGVIFGCEK